MKSAEILKNYQSDSLFFKRRSGGVILVIYNFKELYLLKFTNLKQVN
jgi:hypothetical protein